MWRWRRCGRCSAYYANAGQAGAGSGQVAERHTMPTSDGKWSFCDPKDSSRHHIEVSIIYLLGQAMRFLAYLATYGYLSCVTLCPNEGEFSPIMGRDSDEACC